APAARSAGVGAVGDPRQLRRRAAALEVDQGRARSEDLGSARRDRPAVMAARAAAAVILAAAAGARAGPDVALIAGAGLAHEVAAINVELRWGSFAVFVPFGPFGLVDYIEARALPDYTGRSLFLAVT